MIVGYTVAEKSNQERMWVYHEVRIRCEGMGILERYMNWMVCMPIMTWHDAVVSRRRLWDTWDRTNITVDLYNHHFVLRLFFKVWYLISPMDMLHMQVLHQSGDSIDSTIRWTWPMNILGLSKIFGPRPEAPAHFLNLFQHDDFAPGDFGAIFVRPEVKGIYRTSVALTRKTSCWWHAIGPIGPQDACARLCHAWYTEKHRKTKAK